MVPFPLPLYPNDIPKTLGVCSDFGKGSVGVLYPEVQYGNFWRYIRGYRGIIPMGVKLHWVFEVCQGIWHLHSLTRPMVHGDIALRNVILDSRLNCKLMSCGSSPQTWQGVTPFFFFLYRIARRSRV